MPYFENADDLSYFLWKKKKKSTQRLLDEISWHDEPSINSLKNIYSQLISIYDEIIDDASTQLNDSQYCETTSWSYEDKLKELEKLGFTGVYVPESNRKEIENEKYKLKLIYLKNLGELMERMRWHGL